MNTFRLAKMEATDGYFLESLLLKLLLIQK